MTLETALLGQKQQPCNSPALLPLQVLRATLGKGWEPRGTPASRVASGSWNPDRILVHVSQVAPQVPILRACRALSRGQ